MAKFSIVKRTVASRIFDVFNMITMILLLILFIYPFWNQVILSFNVGTDAVRGGIYLWPRQFTWSNYEYAFGMVEATLDIPQRCKETYLRLRLPEKKHIASVCVDGKPVTVDMLDAETIRVPGTGRMQMTVTLA